MSADDCLWSVGVCWSGVKGTGTGIEVEVGGRSRKGLRMGRGSGNYRAMVGGVRIGRVGVWTGVGFDEAMGLESSGMDRTEVGVDGKGRGYGGYGKWEKVAGVGVGVVCRVGITREWRGNGVAEGVGERGWMRGKGRAAARKGLGIRDCDFFFFNLNSLYNIFFLIYIYIYIYIYIWF
jgi:hypothetical protein